MLARSSLSLRRFGPASSTLRSQVAARRLIGTNAPKKGEGKAELSHSLAPDASYLLLLVRAVGMESIVEGKCAEGAGPFWPLMRRSGPWQRTRVPWR
jgi:hypothetical protein